MNRHLILTAILCLCVYSTAGAQGGGRWIPPTNPYSVTLNIYDATDKYNPIPLPGAQVVIIMGKDTVRIKTDKKGIAFYDGRFPTDTLNITVSYPGYVTQRGTRPAPMGNAFGDFYLKKEIKPGSKPEPASKPDVAVKKDDETPVVR